MRNVGDSKRRVEIQVIVAQVENLKQLHLSEEESLALVNALDRTGKPIEEIRAMGIRVAEGPDYGRIPLDLWRSATKLYTAEEVLTQVQSYVRDQDWLRRNLRLDEQEAKRIAETNVGAEYYANFRALVDKEEKEELARARQAKAWYVNQPDSVQLEIFRLGVERGLVEEDRRLRAYRTTAYVAHLLLPAIEEYRNRMPEGKPDGDPASH